MRRAARRDDNEWEIVAALRAAGCCVRFLNEPCDLLVGRNGATVLLEVKDGNKPPSARKLTEREAEFHKEWNGGPLYVVHNVTEALDIIESLQ